MLAFGMPAFTPDDVARIAALANLELDAAEIGLYTKQLGDILSYADALQEVDTAGVAPAAHAAGCAPTDRPDEILPSLNRRDALANAPDAAPEAGLFKVPRVIG